MNSKLSWLLVIVVAMVLGGAIVLGLDQARGTDNNTSSSTAVTTTEPVATGSNVVAVSDVADLYDKVSDSVVRITGQTARTGSSGIGSGVVLDKQGHILTNNHVVSGFDQIDVTLEDGTASTATILGTDPGNDLAVIKVDMPADKLKPVSIGDSTKVRIGEMVVAIGNPFGINGTLTQGIVSGLGRTLTDGNSRPLRKLIQSDAAINPGNSGGGLFNASGELIGITTAIENPSGERVFVGIGYAVPAEIAKAELNDLIAGKRIEHPRMGVGLQDVTPALVKSLNLQNVTAGVMITTIDNSSAAAKAGLRGATGARPGDVIVSIDNKDVKAFDDLASYIDSKKVGDKISVKYVRDGQTSTVDVTLDAWQSTGA